MGKWKLIFLKKIVFVFSSRAAQKWQFCRPINGWRVSSTLSAPFQTAWYPNGGVLKNRYGSLRLITLILGPCPTFGSEYGPFGRYPLFRVLPTGVIKNNNTLCTIVIWMHWSCGLVYVGVVIHLLWPSHAYMLVRPSLDHQCIVLRLVRQVHLSRLSWRPWLYMMGDSA